MPHYALLRDIPAWVTDLVKQRFAAAEEGYWKGQQAGIREEDLVAALNSVAAQLKLPEYAKTSQNQIHYLRMETLQWTPRFMGLKVAKESPTGEPTAISDRTWIEMLMQTLGTIGIQ